MKMIIAAALLLPVSAAAGVGPAEEATPEPSAVAPDPASMPNLMDTGGPGCPSIARQVADANEELAERRGDIRTLDREPPAHAFLAVDRHVDGCRKVTFLHRNIAPGSVLPNPGDPPAGR